jgi:hypothetical protein
METKAFKTITQTCVGLNAKHETSKCMPIFIPVATARNYFGYALCVSFKLCRALFIFTLVVEGGIFRDLVATLLCAQPATL